MAAELLAGHAGLIALREDDGGWQIALHYGIPAPSSLPRPPAGRYPRARRPGRFELPEVNRRLQRITEAATMGLLKGVGAADDRPRRSGGGDLPSSAPTAALSRGRPDPAPSFAAQAAIAVHNARLYTEVAQQKRHLDAILEFLGRRDLHPEPLLPLRPFQSGLLAPDRLPAGAGRRRRHDEIIRWRTPQPGHRPWRRPRPAAGRFRRRLAYVEGDLSTARPAIACGITYAPTFSGGRPADEHRGNMRDITKFREAEELKSTLSFPSSATSCAPRWR